MARFPSMDADFGNCLRNEKKNLVINWPFFLNQRLNKTPTQASSSQMSALSPTARDVLSRVNAVLVFAGLNVRTTRFYPSPLRTTRFYPSPPPSPPLPSQPSLTACLNRLLLFSHSPHATHHRGSLPCARLRVVDELAHTSQNPPTACPIPSHPAPPRPAPPRPAPPRPAPPHLHPAPPHLHPTPLAFRSSPPCALAAKDSVWSIHDCDSTLFVLLFKKLFVARLAGVIPNPSTPSEHAENFALLLRAISRDVIRY